MSVSWNPWHGCRKISEGCRHCYVYRQDALLERIDLTPWLGPAVGEVSAGGESGNDARPCDFAWVLALRGQCAAAGVSFTFHQTGARFVKEGRLYRIRREHQHAQARKAGIDYRPER